jgi:ABC-type lipoprotein export system ATPase subunit
MSQKRYEDKELDPIFKINEICCSYIENRTVLVANNIIIPRGKVTILLGPSGSGKSTLLESLGLMSKTVQPGTTNVLFFPQKGEPGYPLEQMWNPECEELGYKIRQDYYSFIFQGTNLMPNFSALENVELTELIQKKDHDSSIYHAIRTMVNDLNIFSLKFDKRPFAFSGGERQRIAFARAVNPDFSMLFGDEPTGNLDHFNSNKLMKFIKDFILKHDNKSALIVSHNIDLALDFADRIIILTKTSDALDAPSIINDEFILDESVCKWNSNLEVRKSLKKEIELLLNQDTVFITHILNLLRSKNCPVADYNRFKEEIISAALFVEENPTTKTAREELFEKLVKSIPTSFFSEKEIETIRKQLTNLIINQDGNDKTVQKNIIKDVIDGIDDKKLKESVRKMFDKDYSHKSKVDGNITEDKKEIKRETPGILKLLVRFFMILTGIILSIVPVFNFLVEQSLSFLKTVYFKIFRYKGKIFKRIWSGFNNGIRTCFVAICRFSDESLSSIDIKKNKLKIIKFSNESANIYKSKEIHPNEIVSMPKYFKNLFFKRESEELLGNNNKNLWLILIILLLTFLAIGFSSGSLEYLEMKMSDPFIRSVTADLKTGGTGLRKTMNIIKEINTKDSLQQLYKIDTIAFFNSRTIHFTGDEPNSPEFGIEGRTIPITDPMLSIILDPKGNQAVGKGFRTEKDYPVEDYSIIITQEMRDKLRCSEEPSFIYLKSSFEDSIFMVPVPVSAIVKSLPGSKIYFLMTPNFYKQIQSLSDRFLFDPDQTSLYAFIPMDSVNIPECKNVIRNYFTEHPELISINEIMIEKFPYSIKSMYKLTISFNDNSTLNQHIIKHIFNEMKADSKVKDFFRKISVDENDFIQTFYPNYSAKGRVEADYLSVNFNDLQEVDAFADFIKNEAGIRLEMSNVERMKNYNFVSKLTLLISVLLIFFSVLMINLFLSNILRTHLNSIRMNIGTFKAFGINIHRIYQRMMFLYIIVPLIFALGLCSLLGYTGIVYHFIVFISKYEVEKNLYFNLLNYWTLASILILLVVNYFTFSRIIQGIFDKHPGDLIYDRSNKA